MDSKNLGFAQALKLLNASWLMGQKVIQYVIVLSNFFSTSGTLAWLCSIPLKEK